MHDASVADEVQRAPAAYPALTALALFALCVGCGDDGQGSASATSGVMTTTDGSSGGESTTTATATTMTSDDETTGEPPPLVPDPGEPRYALVGESVILDGSKSQGATAYQWFFDDGEGGGWTEPMPTPIAEVSYQEIGRRKPILTVFDGEGNKLSKSVTITVVEAPVWEARHASSVIAFGEGDEARIAVVSTDSDEVMIAARDGERGDYVVERRAAVGDAPRTIARAGALLVVAAQGDDRIDALPIVGDGGIVSLSLPHGARPYGVIAAADGAIYATLEGTGEVAVLSVDADLNLMLTATLPAIADARALALLPDGRLAVSRWRSEPSGGEVAIVDPKGVAPTTIWPLQFDPQPSSDTEIGGVPSYLGALVVAPNGREATIASLQANIGEGAYKSGKALAFDTTVRAIVSYVDLEAGSEIFGARKQFDGRGLASAAAYSRFGDYLFVATRGTRSVERIDRFTGAESSSLIDVGYAPEGLAVTADGRVLAVDAALSRELVLYDLEAFAANSQPIARLPIPGVEPLAPAILRGKQLFNDALDPRLGKDGYMACAHCHLDGESDRQVWDFSDRGEGLRDTISLLGHAGGGDGPIHWSANFDEIQDFENDIRGPFAGLGLLDDADWERGTVSQTLGDPKAGLSADLDALAAYVTSLASEPRSPYRGPGGVLPPEAEAGRALFESPALGCMECHSGPRLTDSQWLDPSVPLLHDVGTIGPGSGQRLGMELTGLDTPTLHGLWNSPPYLHDGSAATLEEVLTVRNPNDLHGVTSGLTAAEVEDLVAYMLCLDGSVD